MSGILAIDTASRAVAVAFLRDGAVRVLSSDDETPEHSRRIVQLIDEVTLGDRKSITGIVVVQGPGNFTGLRIGIATAQSLAFGLGVPVLGVPTLQAVSDAAAVTDILAIHPAGRDEFASQRFVDRIPQAEFALTTAQSLDHTAIVGEGAKALGGYELGPAERVTAAVRLEIPKDAGPSVEPIYARAPNITKPREPFPKSGA